MSAPLHPIVQEFIALIEVNNWQQDFETAIQNARKYQVRELDHIHNLEDYIKFINRHYRKPI